MNSEAICLPFICLDFLGYVPEWNLTEPNSECKIITLESPVQMRSRQNKYLSTSHSYTKLKQERDNEEA